MNDDTPMDLTDEERQRVRVRHADPLAERLRQHCINPQTVATTVRAFLAERVTAMREAWALWFCLTWPEDCDDVAEHPCAKSLARVDGVHDFLRREVGG